MVTRCQFTYNDGQQCPDDADEPYEFCAGEHLLIALRAEADEIAWQAEREDRVADKYEELS